MLKIFSICMYLIFIFVGTQAVHAESKHPLCPASQPLRSFNMTPGNIQAWLKKVGSSVKTVKEFVCCLPAAYRSNYMVAHSSAAAQNGTPNNPRIILFTSEKGHGKQDNIPLILSFNSQGPHNMQSKSIEMAYLNPQIGQLEFFDLELDIRNSSKLSPPNPETCMNCHGNQGRVPYGGPKYIFDLFNHWPRFVGGARDCSPEEDRIQKIVQEHAVKSVKNNLQYECLDKSLLTRQEKIKLDNPSEHYPKLNDVIKSFDNRISSHVTNQGFRWAQGLPKFHKYKYFLLGAKYCSTNQGYLNLQDWFPSYIIEKNMNNIEIENKLRNAKDLKHTFLQMTQNDYEAVKRQRIAQSQIKNFEKIFDQGFSPNYANAACSNGPQDHHPLYWKVQKNDLLSDDKLKSKDPWVLMVLDGRRKFIPEGSSLDPSTRFFLEGEGYGTFLIQKSTTPDLMLKGQVLPELILMNELDQSALKQLFKKTQFSFKQIDNFEIKDKQSGCLQLQQWSKQQFNLSNLRNQDMKSTN